MTFGDHNILVQNNALSQIETMQPSYKPPNIVIAAAAHGAIEISSTVYSDEYANPTWRQAFSMSNIAIVNNTIDHAQLEGMRIGVGDTGSGVATAANGSGLPRSWLPGLVQGISIQKNILSNVKSTGVITAYPGLDPSTTSCGSNVVNGVTLATCSSTVPGATASPFVSGSTIQCSSNGTLDPTVSPVPPALLPSQ